MSISIIAPLKEFGVLGLESPEGRSGVWMPDRFWKDSRWVGVYPSLHTDMYA